MIAHGSSTTKADLKHCMSCSKHCSTDNFTDEGLVYNLYNFFYEAQIVVATLSVLLTASGKQIMV